MTDLQIGLIGLGGVAVIGVLAYNKWLEHRHRKLTEEVLHARQAEIASDAMAGSEAAARDDESDAVETETGAARAATGATQRQRVEPVLYTDSPAEKAGGDERATAAARNDPPLPASRQESESGAALSVEAAVAEVRHDPASAPLQLLSPTIDCIAAIELADAAGAYRLREPQREALARIGKAVNWIGYNESAREWEEIADDGDNVYRHIRVGLQLVDRKGPVRDGDLSAFQVAMDDLASQLGGVVRLPERAPLLQAAAQLDEFCAGIDIQIGINVVSQGQVFPGTKLRALAESSGMAIDPDGRFARCDDDGNVLFVLVNQETQAFSPLAMRTLNTHGVTFLLDVPRVANGDRVLMQMFELARRFADSLHGVVVDDNRRPLVESSVEPIRRQVVQYQTAMATRRLPAGGPLAQRLFS